MYQPVNGSREAVCSGGHIGPPLREAGRCSGANGNWCKTGALRGGTEPAPYRNAGNTQGAKAINAQCRFEICRAIVALVSHKAGCSE